MLANRVQKTMFSWLAPVCRLCRLALDTGARHGVCSACQAWYAPVPRCARCGLPAVTATPQCGDCLRAPPPWQTLFCLGDYQFPLSQAVHRLKYQRQFWQAGPLAGQLAECIRQPAPVLVSVPLHWRRHWQRGFNQSELLARHLAQALGSHYQPGLFARTLATAPQQGLSKSQRRRNLARAFALNRRPTASHIAIVDDVVTTGSTVRHLCDLLLEVGIERLDIYCICRTPEPNSPI